jgi:hypothetical protein
MEETLELRLVQSGSVARVMLRAAHSLEAIERAASNCS